MTIRDQIELRKRRVLRKNRGAWVWPYLIGLVVGASVCSSVFLSSNLLRSSLVSGTKQDGSSRIEPLDDDIPESPSEDSVLDVTEKWRGAKAEIVQWIRNNESRDAEIVSIKLLTGIKEPSTPYGNTADFNRFEYENQLYKAFKLAVPLRLVWIVKQYHKSASGDEYSERFYVMDVNGRWSHCPASWGIVDSVDE